MQPHHRCVFRYLVPGTALQVLQTSVCEVWPPTSVQGSYRLARPTSVDVLPRFSNNPLMLSILDDHGGVGFERCLNENAPAQCVHIWPITAEAYICYRVLSTRVSDDRLRASAQNDAVVLR